MVISVEEKIKYYPEKLTFTDRDEYQRKEVAERVISLLTSDVTVSPMVANGGWGTGKTEFCYKLMNLFSTMHQDYVCVYVDAFKADHADEPLMMLLAAILKTLPDTEQEAIRSKAIPAIKFGLKTLSKASVSWVLKQDGDVLADEFENAFKKTSEKLIDTAVDSALREHLQADACLDSLRETIKESIPDKELVIFIDELDRCRPDFAVAILEKIKHVFNVDNVQFVLLANMSQLAASINHCYGAVDAKRYLDKFLRFSFDLPNQFEPRKNALLLCSVQHARQLIRGSSILSNTALIDDRNDANQIEPSILNRNVDVFISGLIKNNNLTLREVETLVRYIEIFHIVGDEAKGFPKEESVGIVLLRLLGVFLFCYSDNDTWNIETAESYENVAKHLGIKYIGSAKDLDQLGELDIVLAMMYLGLSAVTKKEVDQNLCIKSTSEEMWNIHLDPYFNGSFTPVERIGLVRGAILRLRLR